MGSISEGKSAKNFFNIDERIDHILNIYKIDPRKAWRSVILLPIILLVPLSTMLKLYVFPGAGGFILLACIDLVIWMGSIIYFKTRFRPGMPQGKIFKPIGGKIIDPMRRADVTGCLSGRLRSEENSKITIICGTSGVGKSVIATKLLPECLKSASWKISKIADYSPNKFTSSIHDKIENAGIKLSQGFYTDPILALDEVRGQLSSRKLLFIFDQFERFVDATENNNDTKLRDWFRRLIEAFAKSQGLYCIIVVRREYYYQLRFLYNTAFNPFRETIDVPGIKLGDENKDDSKKFMSKLEAIFPGNPDMVQNVVKDLSRGGEALTVEAEMVGFMLEDIIRHSHMIKGAEYETKFGGKRGLIQRYFTRYIDSVEERDIAKSILYALSYGATIRQTFTLSELSLILHRDSTSIKKVMQLLNSSGLVKGEDEGPYFLPHDYLAEQFRELSGMLLDSLEKDNISYFCDNLRRLKDLSFNPGHVPAIIHIVFPIVLVLLVIRLFAPGLGVVESTYHNIYQGFINAIFPNLSKSISIDYFPCFMASTISAIYVWRLQSKLCMKIVFKRWLTWGAATISIIMILLGTYFVHGWLCFASFAGLLIGLQMQYLGKSKAGDWIKQKSDRVAVMSKSTILNMIMGAFLGIGIILLFYYWNYSGNKDATILLFLMEAVISLLFTIFLAICTRNHTLKNKVALFLGAFDRRTTS